MHTQALLRNVAIVLALVVIGGLLGGAYLVTTGLSARPEPGTLETVVARVVRGLVIRAHAGATSKPVPNSDAVIAEGREHFADHCAVCHANDGSGNTEMGRGLYPKAPDMRLPATQSLSDAELFYIIENGVRFTGMPGWSTGTKDGETASWHLVHFIRHLPLVIRRNRANGNADSEVKKGNSAANRGGEVLTGRRRSVPATSYNA